jgi:hypothetical protein
MFTTNKSISKGYTFLVLHFGGVCKVSNKNGKDKKA